MIVDTTENAEVKSAATAAHTDIVEVRDLIKKVFVDKDLSVMDAYMTATTNLQESQTALIELCGQ